MCSLRMSSVRHLLPTTCHLAMRQGENSSDNHHTVANDKQKRLRTDARPRLQIHLHQALAAQPWDSYKPPNFPHL